MDNNPGESTTPEERLRLAEEKLAAAEEKYNNLVDNLDEAVFFLDTRGTITYMSPVIERISGYKVDDLVGKSFSAFVHPDDLPYLYDGLSNQLRGRPEPHEFRVVDTDGSVHFVRTAGRLFSKDGEPAGIAGSLVDITRQRRAEDALVESARQMRHFISVTAHELRHPIAIIKGYVQNLLELDKYHLDEEIVEILGAIEMSSDRLTRLVEELLDVSRIEQGHFAVVAREVEPHIYLHQAAEELRFRTPDCEFVFRLDETMGKVMADPDKFVRLMIILLENALRFAPSPCTVEGSRAPTGTWRSSPSMTTVRGCRMRTANASSNASTRWRKPCITRCRAWGWGCSSPARSSRGTGGASGTNRARAAARSSVSPSPWLDARLMPVVPMMYPS